MQEIERFLTRLRNIGSLPRVCNPWHDFDLRYDVGSDAPQLRRDQLAAYLAPRIPQARLILLAEAVGYQGGRFSGIPLTSERILLGLQPGIDPQWVMAPGSSPQRTSLPSLKTNGFAEPSATIVWGTLRDLGIDPFRVLLWNTFPFHPFDPAKGELSNRTPTQDELQLGGGFARTLIGLCPKARVVAVGRKAADTLTSLGIEHTAVRHPANGGATRFRRMMAENAS